MLCCSHGEMPGHGSYVWRLLGLWGLLRLLRWDSGTVGWLSKHGSDRLVCCG